MCNSFVKAAAGLGCALALAACGGSSGTPNNAGVRASGGIKFSECMRTHGVPNFPDPSPGGGIQISSGSGVNPSSPAFQKAQSTCQKLMPGGGPPHQVSAEAQKLQLLHLAQCMRSHGFTSFPDPTSSPPSSPGGPSGGGLAFGGAGGFISVPHSMLESPGFKQAASACGFPGGGPPPRGSKSHS